MPQCPWEFHADDGNIWFCDHDDDEGHTHETVVRPEQARGGYWQRKIRKALGEKEK